MVAARFVMLSALRFVSEPPLSVANVVRFTFVGWKAAELVR